MKLRIKLGLFALSAGMFALASGGCFFRWLGDVLGDALFFRNID